jgi:hypothetical protein
MRRSRPSPPSATWNVRRGTRPTETSAAVSATRVRSYEGLYGTLRKTYARFATGKAYRPDVPLAMLNSRLICLLASA